MPPFQSPPQTLEPVLNLFRRSSSSTSSTGDEFNPIFILPIALLIFIPLMVWAASAREKKKDKQGETAGRGMELERVQDLTTAPALAYQPGIAAYYRGGGTENSDASGYRTRNDTFGRNDYISNGMATYESNGGSVNGNSNRSSGGGDDNHSDEPTNHGTGSRRQDANSLLPRDFEIPPPAYTP